MKYLKILMLFVLSLAFVACDNDEPSSESIFDTTPRERSVFEQWLMNNYTTPFNIDFIYRYVDSQTNQAYNVVPPVMDKAQAMAIMIKHIWIESYVEVMDGDPTFIKTYAPRVFQLVGSKQYTGDGSEVLGTAEGGMKITLFGVNHIDVDNPYMDVESPFHIRNIAEYDLNYYIFKTLHHEFCHILNQKANYSEEFQTISVERQRSGDWVNVADSLAPVYGFVSGYATKEHREDFAEIFSLYVSHTPEAWNKILEQAEKLSNADVYSEENWWEKRSPTPRADIERKLEMVREYFSTIWKIDIDRLRDIVLRRIAEVEDMDLRVLP
ncbi:MAG: putative zinc-binding metallopeptidase [Prevotella sp.]|nr:putative zinc-binding metallopeptidase [Prevotella sp.]